MVLFYISLETLGSLAIWVYGSISSYLIGLNLSDYLVELARTVQFWVVCLKVLVLGPLLFIIMISDINKDILLSSKIISIAEDTRVFTNIIQIENSDSL